MKHWRDRLQALWRRPNVRIGAAAALVLALMILAYPRTEPAGRTGEPAPQTAAAEARSTRTPRPQATPRPTDTPGPGSAALREEARQAVLNYSPCEGVSLKTAASSLLRVAGVQEVRGSRASYDSRQKLYLVDIDYKAANGAEKRLKFNYREATGAVAAENDDALAILRAMRGWCR